MPGVRPQLAVKTPTTSSFPRDAMSSAVSSARTPLSASANYLPSAGLPSAGLPLSAGPLSAISNAYSFSLGGIKAEDGKTPITPPLAYMEFLRSMNLASPAVQPPPSAAAVTTNPAQAEKLPLTRTSTCSSSSASVESLDSCGGSGADSNTEAKEIESAPSSATSAVTDCSCDCDHVHKTPKTPKTAGAAIISTSSLAAAATAAAATSPHPASPSAGQQWPLSAPATGPSCCPSLHIPPSPITNAGAVGIESQSPAATRSPFSARSVRSPFDWEAALKGRRFADGASKGNIPACSGCGSPTAAATTSKPRSSVRHIREVVTRTVTYTPQMNPAPKGKRRKVE